jgi:hypothetical protein
MQITKDTKVYDIITKYGDIAGIMRMFHVKPVASFRIRKFLTRFITVKWAARVHRVPLDKFLKEIKEAVKIKSGKK